MSDQEIKHLCDYGCNREAKFKLKNGKLCCSKNVNCCLAIREKNRNSNTGRKHSDESKRKISNGNKNRLKPKAFKINNNKYLCDYGCGKIAKYQFKNGKYCCSDEWCKCPIEKKKNGNRVRNRSNESIIKLKKSIKESWKKDDRLIKNIKGLKNYYDNETREQKEIRLKNIRLSWNDERREKQKNIAKRVWKRPEYIKNMKEIIRKKWKDPNYIKKISKALDLKPNKPEIIILNILNKLFPNEWKYVGDYKFWLNGKNPDFVNYNKKKIIEHFGTYFHGKEVTGKKEKIHEQERIYNFEKYGYETLIIWENELNNIEKLETKIQNFNNNNKILLSSKNTNKEYNQLIQEFSKII